MKAMVCTKFGPPDVLQLQEVAKPAPREREVLIKIHAATVAAGDCELRGLKLPPVFRLPLRIYVGLIRPKPFILGQELAGEIEAVGKGVTQFKEGDQVFGWSGFRLATNAEYICLPEDGVLAIKPSNMTYEEAATLSIGGLDALYALRKSSIQSGQKILVNGAGGSIGTFAIQLARYFGAEVTGVDSTEKLEMLRSMGANHVIDYTQRDFTKNGETYDVIFDVIGKSSFSRSVRSLAPNGRYFINNSRLSQRIRGQWIARRSGKQVIHWAGRSASEYAADFKFLKGLSEAGKIHPVIDRSYPLEQLAEAHRYVQAGHKKGHVVITVG